MAEVSASRALPRVLDRLVSPSPGVVGVAERRRARLLATSLLILIALFGGLDGFLLATRPDYVPPWYGYVVLGSAYALSRTRHAVIAAVLVVLMFPVVGFVHVTSGETVDPAFTFGFLVLAILMSTIVLTTKGVVAITLFNLAVMVSSRLVAPGVVPDLSVIVGPLSVNALAGLLAVVYMRHRDQIEAERRAEVVRAQLDLRHAQKMEAIGRFAGGIAHDFNNLLMVIRGNLSMIDRGDAHEDLADIDAAVDSAAALTNQLLTVGRRGELRPEPHPVNEIVDSAARLIGRIIGEDVEVEISLAEPSWWLRADASQLEQALLNLATNARDAMPEGGHLRISTLNVLLSAEDCAGQDAEPGEYVLIRVTDTGVGMGEETRQRVFEPFFTTKVAGKGTGLGLAMVFGTVAQGGGWIRVDSTPGAGTTFELFFPRTAPVARGEPVGETREIAGGGGRILVVEDDSAVRRICVRILGDAGYEVTAANGAAEALARLASDSAFDLVLTDVVMPEMSGPEMATRAREKRPDQAFVFMTGYASSAIPPELGPVINKPFERDHLLALVRRALAAKPAA